MEIIFKNEQEHILDDIENFLLELTAEEQKKISDFIQGVKFYRNIHSNLQPTG